MKKLLILGVALVLIALTASSAFAALGFLPDGTTKKFVGSEDYRMAAVRSRTGYLPTGQHIGGDRTDVQVYSLLSNYWTRINGRWMTIRGWWPKGIWPRVDIADRNLHHRGNLDTLFWCKGECSAESEDPISYPTRDQSGMEKHDNVYVYDGFN